jgi:Cell wall-active antibiotics response 4TMS YvqF
MNNDINNINDQNKPRGSGKAIAGMLLLVIGSILLLRQMDILFIPGWIWSWPTWVIVWGLYAGAKHNFRNPAWFILIFVGVAGMLNEAIPNIHIGNFIWPVAIIGVGMWIILRRNHNFDRKDWKKNWDDKWDWRNHASVNPPDPNINPGTSTNIPPNEPQRGYGDDHLDAVSVFGGVKKIILSKDFKGGDIVNIFGGAELDFTQADINGRVIIDITQIFGGTKIVVPSNWQVVSDIAAVFASVDDKRLRSTASPTNDKILVLKGVSIFAGVDIRSY